MDKLRPCPFCRAPGSKLLLINCEYDKTLWSISCNACKSEMTVRRLSKGRRRLDNRQRVIDAWNRRADNERCTID